MDSCFTVVVFLFLFFLFPYLNLELGLLLFSFWVKDLVISVVFMPVTNRWDDYNITFMIIMIIKQGKFKCIKCMNKGDELYDIFTYDTKF